MFDMKIFDLQFICKRAKYLDSAKSALIKPFYSKKHILENQN